MNTGLIEDTQFLEVDITTSTGINEVKESALGLHVFPNPITDATTITFELEGPEDLAIELFDMAGKRGEVIAERAFNAGKYVLAWSPKDLPNGNYILRLNSAEGMLSEIQISLMK